MSEKAVPLSQWSSSLVDSVARPRKRFRLPFKFEGNPIGCILDHTSLWFLLGRQKVRVAIRGCFDPQGIESARITHRDRSACTFAVHGRTGIFTVSLELLRSEERNILRYRTRISPHRRVKMSPAARDIVFLGESGKNEGVKGQVHFTQKGPSSAIAYASFKTPKTATLLYFQDLGSLNEYCDITHSDPIGIVGGEWPETGMALPPGTGPLPARREVTIADGYLTFAEHPLESETDVSLHFLECLAAIYRLLRRPKTEYHDWPGTAAETLKSLRRSKRCVRTIKGRKYLNAYVGGDRKPPESMVQCSVLVPMLVYEKWAGKELPLARELAGNLESFYDKKAGSVVRWLPGQDFEGGKQSEEEDRDRADSWYIHHTLLNLGRLAELGDKNARSIFFASLPLTIKIAHHFKYHWPIFFDLNTLEVTKSESEPGKGGEQDVPGLYAHVMLQAYAMSQDKRYLKEAERAASTLKGSGLHLLYQTNNTMLAAVALARLWRITQKERYRELSIVCVANMVARLWIWECDYGMAKFYSSFMGVSPLHECSYIAAYEEAETAAIALEYLRTMGDDAPGPVRLFLAEYTKYVLHRGKYYFPANVPARILAKKSKEGVMDRELSIPIEDLQTGWNLSGQVGQEVYGSAFGFIACACAYVNYATAPIIVFCEYPILEHACVVHPEGRAELTLRLGGTSDFTCKLRVLPKSPPRASEQISVRFGRDGTMPEAEPKRGRMFMEYEVAGGSRVQITFLSKVEERLSSSAKPARATSMRQRAESGV